MSFCFCLRRDGFGNPCGLLAQVASGEVAELTRDKD
jgi:hypothetical protein